VWWYCCHVRQHDVGCSNIDRAWQFLSGDFWSYDQGFHIRRENSHTQKRSLGSVLGAIPYGKNSKGQLNGNRLKRLVGRFWTVSGRHSILQMFGNVWLGSVFRTVVPQDYEELSEELPRFSRNSRDWEFQGQLRDAQTRNLTHSLTSRRSREDPTKSRILRGRIILGTVSNIV